MQQFGYPEVRDAKKILLDEMGKLGATRLEAEYSGGNDEGGVNSLKLFGADDAEMEAPEAWITREPKEGDEPYRIRDGVVHEYHPLWEAADGMLSTEFGSWAGEFSAMGTLYANVSENRVWREGSYEESHWRDDDNSY